MSTPAIGLLVKSYAPDLEYTRRLMNSITLFNIEHLPVYLVVPESDLEIFSEFTHPDINTLSEELFASHLVREPTAGFSAGYINQEIVKLSFWELGLCENYFCVDSDAEFIRPFTHEDFLYDDHIPYTFLTEDRDLVVEPDYYQSTWVNRMKSLEKIREAIGYSGPWLFTVHGHAVFSAKVLQSFVTDFLVPRGWDYKDALAVSPYEPTWYNTWLLHTQVIDIFSREPIVKTFHNSQQHLEYQLRGIRKEDAARGFLAVVVNSNYSRGHGVMDADNSLKDTLAAYVPLSELLRAFGFKFKRDVFIQRTPLRKLRVWLGALALKIPGVRRLVQSG
jgi:hypothetical protein